jgi:hypothetical protein
MLQRLTNYRTIEPLRTLSELVQPISSTARKKGRDYEIETPLNRLVDATLPESDVARQFGRMVKSFLNDRTDQATYDFLTAQLKGWHDLHNRLEPDLERSSLLTEVEPLPAMLSKVAEAGLQSLKALYNGDAISSIARDRYLELLEQATGPIAELRLVIVPGVKALVEAVPTNG